MIRVPLGILVGGNRIYNLPEHHKLCYNKEMVDIFTGRNRSIPENPNPAHSVFTEIKEGIKIKDRLGGIKRLAKLLSGCMCPCLQQSKFDVCSYLLCRSFSR